MLRITRRLLATAVLTAIAGAVIAGAATSAVARGPVDAKDEWLTRLDGKHKMLFDAPTVNNGIPLVHLMNWYDTWNTAYGVPDKDLDGVLTFYGMTTFHGLNDAMWAKYKLGEFLDDKDASGAYSVRNPWRTTPVALGMTLPQASIEAMQKRGATFIICNNALTIFSGMVAQKQGLDAKAVYEDMKANILPGVTLVPGMVVAIDKAQEAGLAYMRQ